MADAADARPVADLSKSGRKKRMKKERRGFSLPSGRPPVGKTWDPVVVHRPFVVGGYDVSLRDVTNKPKHTYDGDGPLNVT